MKTKLLTASLLLTAALATGGWYYIKTPVETGIAAPVPNSAPVAWEDEAVSYVSVPVSLDVAELEKLANEAAPKRVNGADGDVDWLVDRTTIKLSEKNGKLVATTRFSGSATYTKWAKGNWPWPARGGWKTKLFQETGKFGGTIEAVIGVDLTKDWGMAPTIKVHVDIDQAQVRLFNSIKISFRDLVESKINAVASGSATKAAAAAFAKAGLKGQVAKAWADLHQTVEIKEVPGASLQIDPVSAGISPLEITGSAVRTTVSIRTRLRGALGKTLTPVVAEALPALDIAPVESPGFEINLPLILDPAKLASLLKPQFEGRPVETGGVKLAVKTVQAFCAGGKLRVVAGVDAVSAWHRPVTGTVILEGTPSLDAARQRLSVKNLEYTLETRNKLAAAANWLLEDTVLRELEARLTVSLAGETDKAARRLAEVAGETGRTSGLELILSDTTIKFSGLEAGNNGLIVALTVSGKASVKALSLVSMAKPAPKSEVRGATNPGKGMQPAKECSLPNPQRPNL